MRCRSRFKRRCLIVGDFDHGHGLSLLWTSLPSLKHIRPSSHGFDLHAALIGEAAEQGEDIILSQSELRVLSPSFSEMLVETRNLLAMGKRLLRGRFEKAWARALVRTLERMDGALLTLAPPLRNWCGEAVITARRK